MSFSLEGYLRHYWPDLKVSGHFRYFACFYCDRPWKFWVNVDDRRPWFYCFRCQRSGDQVRLIMDHLQISRADALLKMRRGEYVHEGIETVRVPRENIKSSRSQQPEHVKRSQLPTEYRVIRLTVERDPIEERAYRYLTRARGVTDGQILFHRLGYAMSGRYDGCVILPITRDGVVVYFVARAFEHNRFKYLNPAKAEVQLGKSEVLFNYDRACRHAEVELTEGYFDALAVGERAMAMLGKTLSEAQQAMLLCARGRVKRIGVRLDEDARAEAYRLVEQLQVLGFESYPILISGDPGERRSEPAVIATASFQALIRHRLAQLP